MQSNVTLNPNEDVTLKTRIYNWIKYLCTSCNLQEVKDIPVMITVTHVTLKFGMSKRQAIRILDSLIEDKLIYKHKIYNKLNIYSISPIDMSHDVLVRIRP